MAKKPGPFSDGPLKAYPHRPPISSDPRWAWRVVYHEGDKQITVKNASGRYTTTEIKALLRKRLADGDWMREEEEDKPQQALTMGMVLTAWLKDCERRLERERISPNTWSFYSRSRKRATGLDALEAERIALATLQDWVDELEDAGHSPRTIKHTWDIVRQAWRWARSRRYVPALDLPAPELPATEGHVYTHTTPTLEEALQVKEELSGWHRVAVAVLIGTGARVGELAALCWPDWQQDQKQLRLSGKTGVRWVPLGVDATAALEGWWKDQGQPTVGPMWEPTAPDRTLLCTLQRACRRAGVVAFTPHGLRRLASTRLIAAGTDPKTYTAMMGHSYQMGLSIYAQAVGERLQAAASALDVSSGTVVDFDAERRRRAGG
jgi:integrase